MILFCKECRVWVYVGSSNSEVVEAPKVVGNFLWCHCGHDMVPYSEGSASYQLNVYESDHDNEYTGGE